MASDILFIHPGNQKAIYQDLAREFTAVDPPIWALLLAGALRRKGLDVAIHDAHIQGWDADIARDALRRHEPRLAVILVYGHHPSASTQTMPAARAALAALKEAAPDLPVALGGTHPSALPEQTLREEPADFIVQGEGLHTLLGLAAHYHGKQRPEDIPGLWRRTENGPAFNGPAPVARKLDEELPEYAWDLLPGLHNYRAHNWHCFQDFARSKAPDFSDVRSPYASIYSSLGCPYDCDYCCIHTLTGGKPGLRPWPIEHVVEVAAHLAQKHGVRNIRLADELFVLNPARVERFCDRMIERGLDMNFWSYARVDTIPEALLPKMKKAGLNWLCLGIESANERVRASVNKMLRRDIVSTVRKIQDHGICIIGNYMFGLPEEDAGTMQETLDLALELNCEFVNFYTVMAYPGSRLYAQARAAGTVPDRWEAFSQHSFYTQPLPTRRLTGAEVLAFRDRAFETYFRDARYQAMIRRKFGPAVCAHLEKMLGFKIRRKLLESASA
ncbi:MAG TPA: radical SAM protein [Kiritimatiellia bacterium]|nr:radical SAM protein [Kiritimatiellia bacterium]HRZ11681.1 radical SAM protein [Kiritimatiellia bacterium]HSA16768.1 radical SAM protein [Kiritimatiellia bacterium]